jgi:hypothetical protein
MQRESVRRGFSVSNQKVALEIDFSGALQVRTRSIVLGMSKFENTGIH